MKIVLVRHGSTDFNKEGLVQGLSDIDLNEDGINEIIKTKSKLSNINFDLCISSPLKRTITTAQIITNNKIPIIIDGLLVERNMGNYEGKNFKEYQMHDFWSLSKNYDINGVEPVKTIMDRTKIFLNKIKKDYHNKTILIVSHAATLRALHFNIVGYDNNTDFYSFKPQNGEAYEYDI